MRTVIYARYSTDQQRDASIEDQLRLCRRHAEREGWTVVDSYSDRAISGASLLRPGIQDLIGDAQRGRFELILTESLDRLSRDQADIAAFYKRMNFAGVRIVTVSEGKIDEIHVGLKGTMGALFLKDLAAKTRRGLQGRIEEGRSGGGRAYGYAVACEIDAHGEAERGRRRVVESEAEIVRRIFREFSTGRSPSAIARKLNAEGVPGPNGKQWLDTTIRGHHERRTGILRNDLYQGKLVWNKLNYVKDPDTGKRISRLNPKSEWTEKYVPELRIVDGELWQQVEDRLGAVRSSDRTQKIRENRFWEARRPKHFLTGLVRCGCCGYVMSAVGKGYLSCARAKRNGLCSNRRSIARTSLERIILNGLQQRLMAPELVREFIAAYHDELNRSRREQEAAQLLARRELENIGRQISKLVDAIAEGVRSANVQHRLDDLERRQSELLRQTNEASVPPVRLHPNLAELYKQKIADLHAALAQPDLQVEAIEILRSLIEGVVIRPAEHATVEIELIGEIAGMVELAQSAAGGVNDKTPRAGGVLSAGMRSSVKVVAGTGFEPVTFRL
ncbi:MAG: recombinase family protein [Alphaproteobacteria bacterium]|nr:recombinase family protein [Alphaproteobacteria bacterium]